MIIGAPRLDRPPAVGPAPTSADVVVLGGGVVGTAIAWRTAERGLTTVLVDPAPGRGASAVAAGMLAPVSELQHGEEALLRLNLLAAERFPRYVAEVEARSGADAGYRASGTLQVALDPDDRARLAEVRAAQQRLGLRVEALTGRACRQLEPMLDPAVSGGTLVPDDHQVDPRLLLRALQASARAAGVHTLVSPGRVELGAGRVAGARLGGGGLVRAGTVVLATGARAGGSPVAAPPVHPVKGQVLRLQMPQHEHLLQRTVRARVRDREVYLVPRSHGELVVGATTEVRGHDEEVTAGAVYELLRDAQAVLPAIGELQLLEAAARCRPGSPDNAPLVGPSEVPGLVLACGHHRNGVLLSGLTADAVADVVTGAGLPQHLEPFSAQRFEPRWGALQEVDA